MKAPTTIIMSEAWIKTLDYHKAKTSEGWVPARPMGYPNIASRIRAAWLVFTGRADALIWPGGQ